MNSQSIKIVFGIWAVLLVVNIYVLFVGKNVRVKKALLPISVVSAGALSVLFFGLISLDDEHRSQVGFIERSIV